MPDADIQVKVNGEIIEAIKPLAKLAQKIKAPNTHVVLRDQYNTQGLTTVISVYDGIQPAHIILDKVYEWAKANNSEVTTLIEKLESDMSWNKN